MKRKYTVRIIAIIALVIVMLATCAVGELTFLSKKLAVADIDIESQTFDPLPKAKNVIMMIGDGMGPTHIEVTKKYFSLDSLYFEKNAVVTGTVVTCSKNNLVTDSAAAATALSTGEKTNNGCIAYYDGKNLQTMAEFAKSLGMGVGIIATETLKGATPSGFSVHNKSRKNETELTEAQINSSVDLYIGSGTDYYADFESQMANKDIAYRTDLVSLEETVSAMETGNSFTRVWGAIDELAEAGNYNTLSIVTSLAIRYLTAVYGENGFFLMVEESHIDKCSHNNKLEEMVKHVLALDIACETAVNYANTSGDTYVFLTADHETGALSYDGTQPLSDALYHSTSHTSTPVRFFCFYPSITSILTQDIQIDNTMVAKINRQVIKNYRSR